MTDQKLAPGTRVLIASRNLYLGAGGMERTAINLANHLAAQGMHVTAVCRKTDQDEPLYPIDPAVHVCSGSFEQDWLADLPQKLTPDVIVYFYATFQEACGAAALADSGIPLILHEGTNPDRAINANWAVQRNIPVEQATAERLALMSMCTRIRFTLPDYRNSLPEPLRSDAVAFPNAFAPANAADIQLRANGLFLAANAARGGFLKVQNGGV